MARLSVVPVYATDVNLLFLAWFSALTAGVLFLEWPRKSSQKEGHPRSAPGCARFLARLGRPGGWLNSPSARTDASRLPPARLRCSAPPRGNLTPIAVLAKISGRPQPVGVRPVFQVPPRRRRATQALADKGRGLSEPRSGEFRSPRQRRVAQGTPRSGASTRGWPFLWLLSFGQAKESTPAVDAEYRAARSFRRSPCQVFASSAEKSAPLAIKAMAPATAPPPGPPCPCGVPSLRAGRGRSWGSRNNSPPGGRCRSRRLQQPASSRRTR